MCVFLFCFCFFWLFACFAFANSAMLQENEAAASLVCDQKIREWLFNRNKFSSQKRKRGTWIKKLNARKQHHTPTTNTPKRSTNAPRRTTRSSGLIDDDSNNIFSPVAKSMFKTPVVKQKHVKKNVRNQTLTNKKKMEKTQQAGR